MKEGYILTAVVLTGKRLLKEFKIETKNRSKTLSIYHGNILEDQSDVVGVPVYDHEESKSDLYREFQAQRGSHLHYSPARKVLVDPENGWTGVSTSQDEQPHILYIHSISKDGDPIQLTKLRSLLKMTFATITSFLFEGNEIQTVALPVLFRKGITQSDYKHYIHLFISESSKFLRKNPSIYSLNIYIWHAEDAENWLQVLNEKLQLSTEQEVSDQQIDVLKKEIVSLLQKPYLKGMLPEWLSKKARYHFTKKDADIQQLANYGSKIVHYLVDGLVQLPIGLPDYVKYGNHMGKIFGLSSKRIIVEWFANYMLSVKTFKKSIEGKHPSKGDEYLYFLQLVQVINYCETLFENEGMKANAEKWIDKPSDRGKF
jgi:hypothetical protein